MASDLLLGFILGVALMGVAFPMKGVLFTILEQKKQIEFLSNPQPNQNVPTEEYPNRKENS